ncbi:hypothetical protein B0O99DRAFT_587850 [Bisporella sp. PMI_857]|nr:hypothetical protein B0O99DRAFT_587850 [Bisporella sp. PMI_857]
MPAVKARIEYLQKLPLYDTVKPYWCFLPPRDGFDPDEQRLDNLEWEDHSDISIEDIRDRKNQFRLDNCGFEVFDHETQFTKFELAEEVVQYKHETEEFLKDKMGAVHVRCYDSRLRKNVLFQRNQLDLNDLLVKEGPARGVHNDITISSGPEVIQRYLSEEEKLSFLKPGYRIRIVNTWRSLVPVLEDRPLALCDSRSVKPHDLIATDRVIPDRVGEVYYLTYNENHKWYWLEHQTSSEPFVFVMYDTMEGSHARFCPHVSFINPRSPPDAQPRESIETRSIVITKGL